MATRYKYQNKYTLIDKSEDDVKLSLMQKALVERVLSRRRVSPDKEITVEWTPDCIFVTIDGQEYMISYDIELSTEVVTYIGWSLSKPFTDEDGEHGERICSGYYKFWNADYPVED